MNKQAAAEREGDLVVSQSQPAGAEEANRDRSGKRR